MANNYQHLLAPGKLGALALRNRIIMSPMGSNLAEEGGFCGEAITRYYEARARGGAGMVIMGSVGISWPLGSPNWRQVAISDDKYIPGLRAVVEAVHAHGCKAAVQLHHGGLEAINDSSAGLPLLCPSAPEPEPEYMTRYLTDAETTTLSEPYMTETCKVFYQEATQQDVQWLIEQFTQAATRAKAIGFDGIELHAGHGYIISNFLSPLTNKRSDGYGGSVENRARLLVEIIAAVKLAVGPEMPVWIRLDSHQFKTGGITNEDAKVTARLAEQAGADAIHCSADGDHSRGTCYSEGHATHTPAAFAPFASQIKQEVNVPIIMPGRIEPEVGDRLIRQGKVDFITMARKLLADPELPNKLMKGRPQDIRPCIYCYTCISQIFLRKHVICAVNAQTGHETENLITPTEQPRNVLVIGGGPAGMEAARVAALRGHQVTLLEKDHHLGGTVFFSGVSYPPNSRLVIYLKQQLKTLGVKVVLGQTATVESVRKYHPDAVIVAVGAARQMPDVPGMDLPHVLDGEHIRNLITGSDPASLEGKVGGLTRSMLAAAKLSGITRNAALMRELSRLWMPIGKRIVMIGGGLVAVELAEFFLERGREVTLLDEGGTFGKELMLVRRWRNMADIEHLGAQCIGHVRLKEVGAGRVTVVNKYGQETSLPADHVIVTSGITANPLLADTIAGAGFEVHVAGDCSGVTYIEGAMHEGNRVGRLV